MSTNIIDGKLIPLIPAHVAVNMASEHILIRKITALPSRDSEHMQECSIRSTKQQYCVQTGPVRQRWTSVCVMERLCLSNLTYDCKHQILVAHQFQLASAILHGVHPELAIYNITFFISELRRTFRIPKVIASLVQRIMAHRVICRINQVAMQSQMMADLPESRVVPDKLSFRHTGLYYFVKR